MLGLRKDQNLLVDHDPRWAGAFEEERARIASAVGAVAKGIEHCGSTAVPGLKAKPILDIYVGVTPLEDWAKCQAPLEALGYDYNPAGGVPGHYIFGRGRDASERSHLVHVIAYDSAGWRDVLWFRDALRADAALRARYQAVKEAAVAGSDGSRPRYNQLKSPFFDALRAGQT